MILLSSKFNKFSSKFNQFIVLFSVAYQQTEDEKDLEYAYFGIFDGHGGREAAVYAKEHLMDHIVRQKGFWSDEDDIVLRAIHEGFVSTHHAMWRELGKDFVNNYFRLICLNL